MVIEDWSIHEEMLLLLFEVCLYKYVSLVRATPSLFLSLSLFRVRMCTYIVYHVSALSMDCHESHVVSE